MKLSANLSFLFTELPFLDRFAAAAAAGFKGVEYLFPYEHAAAELAQRLQQSGLQQVLFNLPAGDWAQGERGIACHPGRRDEFRQGLAAGLSFAKKLSCCRLNCLSGLRPDGVDDAECFATLCANLLEAAEVTRQAGIRLLIEPINSRIDMPGFWLDTVEKARQVIAAVGHPNLGLQFDVYHAQVMGGDPVRLLQELLPLIGHVQIADHPGRHEPGSGAIDYSAVLMQLDHPAYKGWVGCEYRPTLSTLHSLAWAKKWLAGD